MHELANAARNAGFEIEEHSIPHAGHSWDAVMRGMPGGLGFPGRPVGVAAMSLAVRGVSARDVAGGPASAGHTGHTVCAGLFCCAVLVSGSFLTGPRPWLAFASVSLEGLRSGEWWSIWTSLFFTTNPLAYATAIMMILFLLGSQSGTWVRSKPRVCSSAASSPAYLRSFWSPRWRSTPMTDGCRGWQTHG